MLFQKKIDEFIEVNNSINSDLEKKKFSSAIASYHNLKEIYDKSKEQEKYSEEFEKTTKRLIVLMKVHELHDLIHTKDIEKIKENLSEIKEVLKNKENNFQNLYNYIEHHYERYLKIYYYKQKKEELQLQIDKVHKLMEEENYDLALMQFPETMRIYNEMSIYHRNEEIIKELEQLKSKIKMNLLKQRAYAQPAELNVKRIRKMLEQDNIDSSKEKFNEIFDRI